MHSFVARPASLCYACVTQVSIRDGERKRDRTVSISESYFRADHTASSMSLINLIDPSFGYWIKPNAVARVTVRARQLTPQGGKPQHPTSPMSHVPCSSE